MEKKFAIIQIIFVALFLLNISNIIRSAKEKNKEELTKNIIMSVILVLMTIGCYFFSK